MVTKLADGRGQTTLKGREIDAEWEITIRKTPSLAANPLISSPAKGRVCYTIGNSVSCRQA